MNEEIEELLQFWEGQISDNRKALALDPDNSFYLGVIIAYEFAIEDLRKAVSK